MSAAVSPAVNEDEARAEPIRWLVRLIRAQDSYGSWESKSDAELRLHRHQKTAGAMLCHRRSPTRRAVEARHVPHRRRALDGGALRPDDIPNEKDETHGGFGRLRFTAGGWSLSRDIHRFGFETFRELAEAPTNLVDDATAALKPIPTWHGREETDFEERFMSNLDGMGKNRKLQLRAAVAKTRLPGLAEDLPRKWREIEEVAEETFAVLPSWMVPGESSLQ